ncbi:hypothetical protein EVAR_20232_1 [Eumeta japonica]|uniref:Uncharacterized protein n=1 Tax=Eumeta variegata TaxID=151549 RepID=A0A4C1W790_EUMVA|nr:hypothetical protein EVAR_20232_1 [Eumeta japonica]
MNVESMQWYLIRSLRSMCVRSCVRAYVRACVYVCVCVKSFETIHLKTEISERCELKAVLTRAENDTLPRFGHLERKNESRLSKQSIQRVCLMERSERAVLEYPMQTKLVAY